MSVAERATTLLGYIQADPTAATAALALGTSFAFGALHALTPGHGKTVIAAYLVASRGTAADAAFLGSVVSVTHLAGAGVLVWVAVTLSRYLVGQRVIPIMDVVSGGLILVVGLMFLARRFWRARAGHLDDHDHDHGLGGSTGSGRPAAAGRPSRWSLTALGISGGLMPSPEEFAVLLFAVQMKRLWLGISLVVAFTLGLAAVILAVGIFMARSGPAVREWAGGTRAAQWAPVVSALLITALGVYWTIRGLKTAGWV